MDRPGYRRIPYFRRYAVNIDGKVINFESAKEVQPVGDKIGLFSDTGRRTTKRIHIIMNEVWNVPIPPKEN